MTSRLTLEAFAVEHATVWTGQIQVFGRAGAQVVEELAGVGADHMELSAGPGPPSAKLPGAPHRRAQHTAARRSSRSSARARSHAGCRHVATPCAAPHRPCTAWARAGRRACGSHTPTGSARSAPVTQAPFLQILQRLGAGLQRRVVEVDHLIEQRLIAPLRAASEKDCACAQLAGGEFPRRAGDVA